MIQQIGVSSSVSMSDVQTMGGDANQDQFIRDVARHLEGELREFVGGAQPRGDLRFWVVGPTVDPLQGIIYVHHLAGPFDTDDLPNECGAYRAYVTQAN